MCNSAAACKPCDHVRVAAVADALRLSNVALGAAQVSALRRVPTCLLVLFRSIARERK